MDESDEQKATNNEEKGQQEVNPDEFNLGGENINNSDM